VLVHDRRGSGPPLVLIHGIGSRRGAWDPVVPRLAGERELIAIDLPGFGQSPTLPPGVTPAMDAYVDAVEAFLAEAGLERPHVAGNSMGGGIALELARRGSVRSATALSPVGFWSPLENVYGQVMLRTTAFVSRRFGPPIKHALGTATGRTLLLGTMFGRPARLDPEAARIDLDQLAAAPGWDATLPQLRRYVFTDGAALDGVPVTIGWGTRDRLLVPRQAERAKAALPRARHVALDRCGHVPMPDDPEAVAALLLQASAG
jgi:pimeloyl-ACP methyl ester carboxylesterase